MSPKKRRKTNPPTVHAQDDCRPKSLKPLFKINEKVYAAWWSDADRQGEATWYPGVVTSFTVDAADDKGYGPVRYYNVEFDDGDVGTEIEDMFVCPYDDYSLCVESDCKSEWKGVKNVVDSKSKDRWANSVGWYSADIDGKVRLFSRLIDALRARDAYVVRCKGNLTKESDLNLADEWKWLLSGKEESFAKLNPENKDFSEPAAEDLWTEVQLNERVRIELAKQHKRLAIVYQRDQDEAVENAVEEMEKKRTQEVQKLRTEHAEAMTEIEDSHKEKLKDALESLEQKHAREIQMLGLQHQAEKKQILTDALEKFMKANVSHKEGSKQVLTNDVADIKSSVPSLAGADKESKNSQLESIKGDGQIQFDSIKSDEDRTWAYMFTQLEEYKKFYGHLNLPSPNASEAKTTQAGWHELYVWFESQRDKFARGEMLPEQFQKLQNLGADFSVVPTYPGIQPTQQQMMVRNLMMHPQSAPNFNTQQYYPPQKFPLQEYPSQQCYQYQMLSYQYPMQQPTVQYHTQQYSLPLCHMQQQSVVSGTILHQQQQPMNNSTVSHPQQQFSFAPVSSTTSKMTPTAPNKSNSKKTGVKKKAKAKASTSKARHVELKQVHTNALPPLPTIPTMESTSSVRNEEWEDAPSANRETVV